MARLLLGLSTWPRSPGRRKELLGSDDEGEPDEEGARGPGYSSRDLAGLRVQHDAEGLAAGETVVLTLDDKGILNEKGELVEDEEDVLVHALSKEEKARRKARAEAKKQSNLPDWDEDAGAELLPQYGDGAARKKARARH